MHVVYVFNNKQVYLVSVARDLKFEFVWKFWQRPNNELRQKMIDLVMYQTVDGRNCSKELVYANTYVK